MVPEGSLNHPLSERVPIILTICVKSSAHVSTKSFTLASYIFYFAEFVIFHSIMFILQSPLCLCPLPDGAGGLLALAGRSWGLLLAVRLVNQTAALLL